MNFNVNNEYLLTTSFHKGFIDAMIYSVALNLLVSDS